MILYRPIDGDVLSTPIHLKIKTCFLMRQLKDPIPPILEEMKIKLTAILSEGGIKIIDADSRTMGRDLLLKIWQIAISVPIGIALIHKEIKPKTMGNIFYELGLMQALGKETLIIKSPGKSIPSDFKGIEYVNYDENFERHIRDFISDLQERVEYYLELADLVENNPLLAIDYLRRAYLLTGDRQLQNRAKVVLEEAGLSERANDSVEMLLASFIYDNPA